MTREEAIDILSSKAQYKLNEEELSALNYAIEVLEEGNELEMSNEEAKECINDVLKDAERIEGNKNKYIIQCSYKLLNALRLAIEALDLTASCGKCHVYLLKELRARVKDSGRKFDTWHYDMVEVSTVLDLIDRYIKMFGGDN